MPQEITVLNPGLDEAIAKGCTCPVLDNGHGRGVFQDENGEWQFWIREDCPLHGIKEAAKNE